MKHQVRALRASALLAATLIGIALPAQAQGERRTLEVAQIVPQSGGLANVGKEIVAITQAAFDDFNQQPGRSIQLRLRSFDDGNSPEKSAELARSLNGSAIAYLSCFGSVGCLAQQRVANETRTPLIGPIAGAAPLRGRQSGLSYALRASAADEIKSVLKYAHNMGLSHIGVLVQDDGFGRAYLAELNRAEEAHPGLRFSRVGLNPQTPEYRANAAQLMMAQPQAILLLANAAHSAGFLTAWKEARPLPYVFNLAAQANALFASRLKGYVGTAAFVTVTPSPWESKTAVQRDYQRIARNAGLSPSYLGFEAFLNARFLMDSVSQLGAKTPLALARYLDNLGSWDLGGYTVHYAGDRVGSVFTDLALLRADGSYRH